MPQVPAVYVAEFLTQSGESCFRRVLFVWLIVGGILGWLASIVMKTDGQQGIILNVVVGIIGALIGGFVIAPMFGTGTINTNDFSAAGLLVCRFQKRATPTWTPGSSVSKWRCGR